MKTIAFYSYKGGVGRTLALANIAQRLVEFGKSVCMIDFDLEAPGLQHKFKATRFEKEPKLGIVDYIYEFSENENLIPSITPDYYYDLSMLIPAGNNKSKGKFTLIPAGDTDSKDYWKKLSGINWHKMFYDENSQGVQFFLDFKAKIERDINPDYLLIDTRTGITEISSITLSILADRIVFLSANNKENIVGCQRVIRSILQPENNLLGIDKDIILVLTRIPNATKPDDKVKEMQARTYFIQKFSFIKDEFGKEIQPPIVIHSDRDLEYKEEFKIGYDYDLDNNSDSTAMAKESIGQEYLNLFNRITDKDFSVEEKELFYKIKKAEKLFNMSSQIRSTEADKSIKLLQEAIELNPHDYRFYFNLSNDYYRKNEFDMALKSINKGIELKNMPDFKGYKGIIYYEMGEYLLAANETEDIKRMAPNFFSTNIMAKKKANIITKEELFKEIALFVEIFHYDILPYNLRANFLRCEGNYDAALEDIYKAIEIDSDESVLYATLGEIRYSMGNINEFYINLDKAFDLGQDPNFIFNDEFTRDIYPALFKEERFRNLLEKYGFNDTLDKIDEILHQE